MLQCILMLQAIIFDFDGTIAHSEPVHYQATKFTVASLGIHFDYKTHLQEYVGYPCKEVLRRLCAKHQIELKPEQLEELLLIKIKSYQELASTYLQPCEGAVSLIKNLAPHYPLAICTSSQRSAVKTSLLHLDAGSLQQYFQNIITIEDVPAGKPDPTGYRMAANSLNTLPQHCLAIEDSPVGIIAAKAAGMSVIAVTTSYPPEKLSLADRCVNSLAEINLNDIERLL